MNLSDITTASDSTNATPWYQNFLSSLANIATTYLTVDQQKQLNTINLQRAQQGLRPLDVTAYTGGVNVGLSSSTQNTALMVAGIIGGLFLVSKLIKR